MEPETSAPKIGPEQAHVEYGPEHILQATPERGALESGAEQTEQASEQSARASDADPIPVIAVPTTVIGDDAGTVTDDAISGTAPATAADDDLIEKEWVDRAKKIVSDTRDNPHNQENAVTALQRDYRKKRYGRELGDAN
ncbi:hypothetical protein BH10PAT4_BH10PAT4_1710 [soil metagenome]